MEGIRCHKCGEIAEPARVKFNTYEIDGWRCKCGEEFCDPEQSQRILLFNKLKNKSFSTEIGQIKDHLIVTIPKDAAEVLQIEAGKKVSLKIHDLHHMTVAL
ncbi:hypothetical protein KKH56_03135 [bacterium]|nr:hypothetical protein [bacterium]